VITTATTEAQATGGKKKKGGKQPIGEGGFKADLSIGNSLDRLIQQNLTDRLEGRKTTFSEDVVDAMKEKLFRETQGQTRRGRMALMADAARRGVFRSEATGSLIRDIELAGLQQYSSGVKDILLQKAMKDHEDMTTAIGQSQQWLQGLRQYALGLEQNAIAREQVKATLAAAAMQASASRYAADQALKGAQAAAGASRYAANMAYNAQRAVDSSGNYIGTMTMSQYEFAARNGT
jgi:hypothetical protein